MAKKRSENDDKGCRLCLESLDDLSAVDDLFASYDTDLKELAYLDDYSALDDLLPAGPTLDDIFAHRRVGRLQARVQHRQEGTDQQKSLKALAEQRHRLVVDQIAHLQKQNGDDACAQ